MPIKRDSEGELRLHGDVVEWVEHHGIDRFCEEAVIVSEDRTVGEAFIAHRHEDGGRTLTSNTWILSDALGMDEEELVRRIRGESDEKRTKEPEIIIGGMEIRPVSLEELDVEPDQGAASRMTIRNLDRTILEVVKARLGADSDAEAVRKALMVAGEVLLED